MQLARAHLVAGNSTLVLPVNPLTANWGYQENSISTDTLGGRVVQLLSVQVTELTVESVAGSRRELQKMAEGVRSIMEYHVTSLRPASFRVPSRKWHFRVYITAMPQMGWDVSSTSYPYQLQMAVDEDINGVKTKQVAGAALERLYVGVGYNAAVHGGDPTAFDEIVKSVLAAAGPGASTVGATKGGGTGGDASGSGGKWQGSNIWQPQISNAPWTGNNIRDQISNCWSAVFGSKSGQDVLCIVAHESGFNPRAYFHYGSGSGFHYVYGLFQISDIHKGEPWFPTSTVHGKDGGLLFDPEYNTRCAMTIYKQQGWGPWSTAGGCGL